MKYTCRILYSIISLYMCITGVCRSYWRKIFDWWGWGWGCWNTELPALYEIERYNISHTQGTCHICDAWVKYDILNIKNPSPWAYVWFLQRRLLTKNFCVSENVSYILPVYDEDSPCSLKENEYFNVWYNTWTDRQTTSNKNWTRAFWLHRYETDNISNY